MAEGAALSRLENLTMMRACGPLSSTVGVAVGVLVAVGIAVGVLVAVAEEVALAEAVGRRMLVQPAAGVPAAGDAIPVFATVWA